MAALWVIPSACRTFRVACRSLNVHREFPELILRRAKREARTPFFLGFPRKKKPLHKGSCEACRVFFFNFFLCVFLCMFVSVNIVIGHLGRPRSTHTTPMAVPMGSVHAQVITTPSRAGLAVSRSELVEPGEATFLEAWWGRV